MADFLTFPSPYIDFIINLCSLTINAMQSQVNFIEYYCLQFSDVFVRVCVHKSYAAL